MISIGAIFGGPEFYECATTQIISHVSLAFLSKRGQELATRSGQIGITLLVPGSLSPSTESGVHIGRISRRNRKLNVRAYVPKAYRWVRKPLRVGVPDPNLPTASQSAELRAFIFDVIRESISTAAIRFARAKIEFAHDEIEHFVADVQRELATTVQNPL